MAAPKEGGLDFPEPFEGKQASKTGAVERAPKPATASGRAAPLAGRLQEAIGGIGIFVALVNEVDGLAIIEGAERLSLALDKAARQSPSLKRTLEAVLTGSVWAEVAFASGAIIVPIAVNHNLLPAMESLGWQAPSPNGDTSSERDSSSETDVV